jgi:hypothetical protein
MLLLLLQMQMNKKIKGGDDGLLRTQEREARKKRDIVPEKRCAK